MIYETYLEDDSQFVLKVNGIEIVEAKFFSRDELSKISLDGNVRKYLQITNRTNLSQSAKKQYSFDAV